MALELKIGDWVLDSSWTPNRIARVEFFGREGKEKRVVVYLSNGRTDEACSAWGPVELDKLSKVIKVED